MILQLYASLSFKIKDVQKITDNAIHKIYEKATMPVVNMISLTSETIDICKILLDTMDNWAGGTVLFTGSVRDHNEDGTVSEIYYEAYKEMAEKSLTEIEIEARKKWNVKKFVAVHRVGNLKVGEVAIVVAASAEHRKVAFEACRYGIDEIKIRVPIWKKEIADSGIGWVEGASSKSE